MLARSLVRQLVRLASALVAVFFLVFIANSRPEYLGPLEPFLVPNQEIFVGTLLILAALLLLWRGGHLRGVQSRGRLPAFEFVIAGLLLLALTATFGLGLSPFNMCLGGGGGFTCYPDTQGFLHGLLGLMCIVLGEEFFFVAYVTRELNQILRVGALAVFSSTLFYSFFHLPALQVEGFGSIFQFGFLEIFLGTFSLIACYWYTGRNLAAVVLLHAYWDGVGALVLVPDVMSFGPILLLLGQLSLPAVAVVVTHTMGVRLRLGVVRPEEPQDSGHEGVTLFPEGQV